MSILKAFSAEHVSLLTGASQRQLRYWDQKGVLSPTYSKREPGEPFATLYSFRDVVGIRTLTILRKQHHVSLQELRKVGEWFRKNKVSEPWTSQRFYVVGRRVLTKNPETKEYVTARPPHQVVMPFDVQAIASEMEQAANRLRDRSDRDVGRIDRHRTVAHNSFVIAGTRVTTEAIWSFHSLGYDTDAILREYPTIRAEDVQAAIEHESSRHAKRAG